MSYLYTGNMRSKRRIWFLLIIFSIIPCQLISQVNYPDRKVRWDFNVSTGFNIGGPGDKLDNYLNIKSYNRDLQTKNYLPLKFSLNRTIGNKLGAGLNVCILKQELLWSGSGFLDSRFKTLVINPKISYCLKDLLFISIGPALNRISYYHPTGTSLEDIEMHMKIGFILNNTIKFPPKSFIYFHGDILYSYGGTISTYYHIEKYPRQYTYTVLRLDNLPLNYFYAGAGLGIRIFRKTDQSPPL